jgi:hypothetical protein
MEDRRWFLKEGLASAKLTIPSILSSDQDASNIVDKGSQACLVKPWQSIGAKGVRNLTSKLGLTLFPPTGPFMRYQLGPEYIRELETAERSDQKVEIEKLLAVREQTIMEDIERNNIRTKVDQALRHLVVVGNVLLYLVPKGGMRVFPLNNYVVRRDFTGNVLELIYLELLDKATLPKAMKKALVDNGHECSDDGTLLVKDGKNHESCAVYTKLMLKGKRFEVTQEIEGTLVDLEGKTWYAKDKMPFLALRMVSIDGEDYGRGFVEEIRGDLKSAEELRKANVIAALNAAKLIALVSPGAAVTPKKLLEAENGAAILGRADDVVMLQQNKQADMQAAHSTYIDLKQDLAAAFLLSSSSQRDAERVTAEEIRRNAEELEDALGGIYSVLAQELQLPIALAAEARLVKEKALPKLEPEGLVMPVIITGLAAIGRGHEFNRLREYIGFIREEVAPMVPEVAQYFITRELLERPATGLGVLTDALLKTDEAVAKENQQAQQQSTQQTLMEGAAPHLGKAASSEMVGGMAGGGGGGEGTDGGDA